LASRSESEALDLVVYLRQALEERAALDAAKGPK
jgi:hypothetical protein